MTDYLDPAYAVTSQLAEVPWWSWLALLAMIFIGLLAPRPEQADDHPELRLRQ